MMLDQCVKAVNEEGDAAMAASPPWFPAVGAGDDDDYKLL